MRFRASTGRKPVADTADGLNARLASGIPQFLSDIGHIDVNQVRAAIEVMSPDVLVQCIPVQGLPHMLHEVGQQGKLAGSQRNLFGTVKTCMSRMVKNDPPGFDSRFGIKGCTGHSPQYPTAQEGLDPGHELLECKWFGYVVIGPRSESTHAIFHGVEGAQHDNRQGMPHGPQMHADIQPTHAWKPDVEQHQVRRFNIALTNVFPPGSPRGHIALLLQTEFNEFCNVRFVFYNQYMSVCSHENGF